MTLNATLFLQIFHFILAYFILDRLLLRKAVDIIQKEQADQEALMNGIQKERDAVAEKQEQKQIDWQRYQNQFMEKIPQPIIQPKLTLFEKKTVSIPEVSENEINRYAHELKSLLIEKVTNDSQ